MIYRGVVRQYPLFKNISFHLIRQLRLNNPLDQR